MSGFSVGEISFKTKKAATLDIRRILHSAAIDAPLEGDSLALIAALYETHPRREGSPVTFCVGTNNYHGALTRGFHAIHADGSRTRWSYIPCLNPAADEPSLLKVLRAAIIPSQREILRIYYHGKAFRPCSHCTKPVQREDANVHHLQPKFRDISDAFIGLIGMPQVRTGDDLGDDFVEPGFRQRWVQFHDAVAQRIILCPACNAADEKNDK